MCTRASYFSVPDASPAVESLLPSLLRCKNPQDPAPSERFQARDGSQPPLISTRGAPLITAGSLQHSSFNEFPLLREGGREEVAAWMGTKSALNLNWGVNKSDAFVLSCF